MYNILLIYNFLKERCIQQSLLFVKLTLFFQKKILLKYISRYTRLFPQELHSI